MPDDKPSSNANTPADPQSTSQQAVSKVPVFLVGAGLGLLAAYLLDPEHGKKRRQNLADQGARASQKSVKHLNHGWRDVIHRVSGFLHELTRITHLSSDSSNGKNSPTKKADSTKTDHVSH